MQIKFSSDAIKDLKKIKLTNQVLYQRIEKQLALFKDDPRHPSLRIHKLTGKTNESWSLSVISSIRMVYIHLGNDGIYIVGVGTHDQVYRK